MECRSTLLSAATKRILLQASAVLAVLAATPALAQQSFDALSDSSRLTAAQSSAAAKLGALNTLRVDTAGIPYYLEANLGSLQPDEQSFEAGSDVLMSRLSRLYRMDGTETLRLKKTNVDSLGQRHVRVLQMIDGLEVIGGDAVLHLNDATGQITSIDSQFLPGTALPRAEKVSAKDAFAKYLPQLGKAGTAELATTPRLAFLRTADAKGYLVWDAQVQYVDAAGITQLDKVRLDTQTGAEVEREPAVLTVLSRAIYRFSASSPNATGSLIVSEGNSTTDRHAQAVYNNDGITYNYYMSTFSRDSWNGSGGVMRSVVHGTTVGQDNAVFSANRTYFGDGQSVFSALGYALDVVGHEWTHGVVASEAGLGTGGQPGWLNEHYADIFGASIEAFANGVSANTWLLGESVYTPGTRGDALRYLGDPARDGISRDYYPGTPSNLNSHYGSGIGNLAFYLLVNGGSHPRGTTSTVVNGIGMQAAQRIFYITLRDRLTSRDGYPQLRTKTVQTASAEYGANSTQLISTCRAWDAVGVPNSGTACNVASASTLPIMVISSSKKTKVSQKQ